MRCTTSGACGWTFLFYIMYLFIYVLFLAVLCLPCYMDFSLLAVNGDSSPVAVHGLLHYHGFSCCKAQTLDTDSIVVVQRFRCSTACGIFLDQGSNPCLLHWQVDSLPPSHQGNLQMGIYSHESNLLSLLLIQGKTHSSFGAISFVKLSIQKKSNSWEQQRREILLSTSSITTNPFLRGASRHQADWQCETSL